MASPFIGVNLFAADYYTPECMTLDRMKMRGDPFHDNARCDPISGLPTIAGDVTYQVPLDPVADGAVQDYVILCDENVVEVHTPWGGTKPVKGRGVIQKLRSSISGPFEVITKGAVEKLQIVRADQEKRLLAGEVVNPDFLTAIKPFRALRLLDPSAANYDPPVINGAQTLTWPPRRPQLSDGYFTTARGGAPAELFAMIAKLSGKPLWYTIHHLTPIEQILEIARICAIWGVRVKFEWSNEFGWNFHKIWAYEAARAHYNLTKAAYVDVLRYYGWRAGMMAKALMQVSAGFKVELASQGSDGVSNLPPLLKGWDESGAPRSCIAGYANPSYLNLNDAEPNEKFTAKYLDMALRKDEEAFYRNVSSKVDALVGRHVKAIAASKAENLAYDITETNTSWYTESPWVPDLAKRQIINDWVFPLLHSARMADILANCIQRCFTVGVREIYAFELSGAGNQHGVWGLTPHIMQEPYPIYKRLVAMNATSQSGLPV